MINIAEWIILPTTLNQLQTHIKISDRKKN